MPNKDKIIPVLEKVNKEKLKVILLDNLNIHVSSALRAKIVSVVKSEDELRQIITTLNHNNSTINSKLLREIEDK